MKRPFAITIASLLLLAITFVSLLPVVVTYAGEKWLREQGVADPVIANIDLNLFTGVLRVEGLQFSGDDARASFERLEANFDWLPLARKRLEFISIVVSGGHIDTAVQPDGAFRIGGLTLPGETDADASPEAAPSGSGGSVWGFAASNVQLEDVDFGYRDDVIDSRVDIDTAKLDRVATWEGEADTTFSVSLTLDGTPVSLSGTLRPFDLEPSANAMLDVDGLAIGHYAGVLDLTGVNDMTGELWIDLAINARIAADNVLSAQTEGEVRVDEASATLAQGRLSGENISWRGVIRTRVATAGESPLDVSGTSTVNLNGVALQHPTREIRLLTLESLRLEGGVILGTDRVDVDQITLNQLELIRSVDDVVLTIEDIAITDVAVAGPASLQIADIRITGLQGDLMRQADGSLAFVSDIGSDLAPTRETSQGTPAESSAGPSQADAAPLQLRLGRAEITGNSAIRFRDDAVSPSFVGTFLLQGVSVDNIDSTKAEQPTRFTLAIGRDDMMIVGEGEAFPFAETPSATFTTSLERVNLTEVSPYLPAYDIRRGRLSLTGSGSLTGGELDLSNKVRIERLQLVGRADAGQPLLGQGMAMPLDVALDLLRDRNDTIELKLPISGQLDDLQLDTGDIMRTAMQGALQKAALSYAKNALQPLGTIMLIAKVAGQAARPRFDPVVFDAGAASLSDSSRLYLDKVRDLLVERDGLHLTFCGVSTLADREYLLALEPAGEAPPQDGTTETAGSDGALEIAQLELASARGNAIQSYLTTAGVDGGRLFRCLVSREESNDEPPRAELML